MQISRQQKSLITTWKLLSQNLVWDVGRIAIGLLNNQLYAPAIEMLDEAVNVLLENQGEITDNKPERITFSKSPSVVVPANINEGMTSADLLQLQYKAMKQVIKVDIRGLLWSRIQLPIPGSRNAVCDTVCKQEFQWKVVLTSNPTASLETEQNLLGLNKFSIWLSKTLPEKSWIRQIYWNSTTRSWKK